jgi:multidrug transporter EmrE-like cation transporter
MSYQDLVPLISTEIVGDFGYKEFANKGGFKNFMVGTLGYIGVIYYLIRSLQGSNILFVNGYWDGLSGLFESIFAYVILGERFEDPIQYAGVVFIIIGLFFMKAPLKRKNKFMFPKMFFKLKL